MGRHEKRTPCTLRARPVAIVEDLIVDHYSVVQTTAELLAELKPALIDELAKQRSAVEIEHAAQRRRTAELEVERRKLLELHYADAIPLSLFKEEQQRITRELAI